MEDWKCQPKGFGTLRNSSFKLPLKLSSQTRLSTSWQATTSCTRAKSASGRNSCLNRVAIFSLPIWASTNASKMTESPVCMSKLVGWIWNWTGWKKKLPQAAEQRHALVVPNHPQLSMRRQCQLLGVSRSTFYYQPATESEDNLHLIRQIDEQYMQTPFYGSRRMTEHLKRLGYHVNRNASSDLCVWWA